MINLIWPVDEDGQLCEGSPLRQLRNRADVDEWAGRISVIGCRRYWISDFVRAKQMQDVYHVRVRVQRVRSLWVGKIQLKCGVQLERSIARQGM